MYFDSHAHLTSDSIYPEIDDCLQRAQKAGVSHIANICTDPLTLARGLDLVKKNPWVYNVGATTPHDVEKEGEEVFPIFEKAAREGQLVAVGETGLDYHYEHSSKELQKEFLVRYMALAEELNLPVVIHCREAFDDLFTIAGGIKVPLILHCFTGSLQEAEKVIEKGWYLSLSGIVTFKRSEELCQVAKIVPLDQLLIETDTPYLAPMPYRGKQNEPAFIAYTAKHIAQLKEISASELATATTANAMRVFDIANQ
ncbi:MAG: TatD family hydrolase [Chlamydiales bacterium]|nr:TatD family hydrolase [Chlamydiales bacterium]